MITKDLGAVTAYAYAVEGGYTGTEEEFTQLMADLGITVDEFEHFSVSVSTLPAGSSATASYSDGVLSLGIPKGDKGDTGNTGATGATPNLSIGTVETTAEPSVTITGTVDNPVLNFGLVKGDKGETGEVSEAELTQAFEDFSANGTVANAEQLTTDIRANDQTPYLFRTAGGSVDIGDREYINGIVGGTVAFNQQQRDYTEYSAESNVTIVEQTADHITFSSTQTNNGIYPKNQKIENVYQNHIYIASATVKAEETADISFIIGGASKMSGGMFSVGTSYKNCASIIKFTASTTINQSLFIVAKLYRGNISAKMDMNLIDLTQMFGSTIADYIYSLEQANAGAGVAFFKSLFPKPYYAYNAGELKSVKGLVSHDMTGFNAFDKNGTITTGYLADDGNDIYNTNWEYTDYIRIVPSTVYFLNGLGSGSNPSTCWYDADKNFISGERHASASSKTITSPSNACYMRTSFPANGAGSLCINLSWDGSEDGEYEPYQKWSYPLDSSLELRGIPKIENGNLYYDGDVYEADGTVTRKYGIVDLGTKDWTYNSTYSVFWTRCTDGILPARSQGYDSARCSKYLVKVTDQSGTTNLPDKSMMYASSFASTSICAVVVRDSAYTDATAFKTAMSGVYLVYELATPTTETADPYTSPQIVSDFGTEEYVIDDDVFAIPVGHNTDYPVDLKAKLEMAPNSPPGDGMYVVKQTSGTNEYVPLIIPSGIPPVPTENGSYTLTATVSGGTTTLSWS